MSHFHPGRSRPRGRPIIAASLCLLVLAGCGPATPTPPPATPSDAASRSAAPSEAPAPTPSPTPQPSARDTNEPDPELVAIIPLRVAGHQVEIPSTDDFPFTPADIGPVYGELGPRFRSVQVAFVPPRLLSLYAVRMEPPDATTEDLEPYLAAAGQYVGIAGLHRRPWKLRTVAGHRVWVRPEDDATALGTMIYTWATDGYLFLMIGTNAKVNRAMLAALPGEAPPASSASPSGSAPASGSPSPSGSAPPSGG